MNEELLFFGCSWWEVRTSFVLVICGWMILPLG
jgi:hypothetical protein